MPAQAATSSEISVLDNRDLYQQLERMATLTGVAFHSGIKPWSPVYILQLISKIDATGTLPAAMHPKLDRIKRHLTHKFRLTGSINHLDNQAYSVPNSGGNTRPPGTSSTITPALSTTLWGGNLYFSSQLLLPATDDQPDILLREFFWRRPLSQNLELSIGRQAQWWGPGHFGSLALSTNIPAANKIVLTNPLPKSFWGIGEYRLSWFLGLLTPQRAVYQDISSVQTSNTYPKFVGLNLSVTPTPIPYLELGMEVVSIFLERSNMTYKDYFNILLPILPHGEDDTNATNRETQSGGVTDRIATMYLSLNIPRAIGPFSSRLWWEYSGEDFQDPIKHFGAFPWLSAIAHVYGLSLDSGSSLWELELTTTKFSPVPWYDHYQLQEGYRHDGRIIGHYIGADSESLELHHQKIMSDHWDLGLTYRYFKQNAGYKGPDIAIGHDTGIYSEYHLKGYTYRLDLQQKLLLSRAPSVDSQKDNLLLLSTKYSW